MKHTTLGLIVTLALGLLWAPLVTDAQPRAKVPQIGILSPFSPRSEVERQESPFRQGLRELGYVEGQNITLEGRWAEGRVERLADLAAELVRLNVDVIVVVGELAIQAAKQATTTIPIVMTASGDPVGIGLVASLARPGGNITGLATFAPELSGKLLELLRETLPQVARVAVLWNSVSPAMTRRFRETQVAARALGVALHSLEIQDAKALEGAFAAVAGEPADALLVFAGPLTAVHRKQIVEFAAKSRLPMISENREFTEWGGLMSYGASRPDLSRRAAIYVDKILKGAKPADLPIEQPMKFELVINLKTAKELGLTIPPTLLFQADEVIR